MALFNSSSASLLSNTVNESISNTLLSNSSQCNQSNSAIQSASFKDISAGEGCSLKISSTQNLNQMPSFTCLSENVQKASLTNDLKTKLTQKISTTNSGIPSSLINTSDTSTIDNLTNELVNNIDISSIASCSQDNLATQDAAFNSIKTSCPYICRSETFPPFNSYFTSQDYTNLCTTTIGSEQSLIQAAVAKCTSTNTALADTINKITNETEQESTLTNAGIFASLASGGTIGIIAIVLVVLFCSSFSGFFAYLLLGSD